MNTSLLAILLVLCLGVSTANGVTSDGCPHSGGPGNKDPLKVTECKQQYNGKCFDERCDNCTNGYTRTDLCGNRPNPNNYRKCCIPGDTPTSSCCEIFGDPHIHTYDGRYFNIQKTGWFNISRSCYSDDFALLADFEYPYPEAEWTRTVRLEVLYEGVTIDVNETGSVWVDGESVSLRYFVGDKHIYQDRVTIYIELGNIDVKISYNIQTMRVMVCTIHSRWFNELCGLCGNMNNDVNDDEVPPVEGTPECPLPTSDPSWSECRRRLKDIVDGCTFTSIHRYLVPCAFDICTAGEMGAQLTIDAAREHCLTGGSWIGIPDA